MNTQLNKRVANQQLSYDLIIIGAGPAGLAASIYASRYKLSNLVIGKTLGGELSLAHKVCNFPGIMDISGIELGERMKQQAESLGAKVLLKEVGKIEVVGEDSTDLLGSDTKLEPLSESHLKGPSSKNMNIRQDAVNAESLSNLHPPLANNHFKISINDNEIYKAKALIVATGSERRRLNVPGEKEYLGKGISYCHTCDGPFFLNKTVAVIGGSDSAVSGAVHLAEYAAKIKLIYRGEQLRAEPIWLEEWQKIEQAGKGETVFNTNITAILGGQELSKLKIKNEKLKMIIENLKLNDKNQVTGILLDKPYQGENLILVDGVFIEIGAVPGTALVQSLGIKLEENGHVLVNDEMETNIQGIFCAGDMVSKSAKFKQATWAIAQGAMAAASAFKYIKKEAVPQIRGI